MSKRLVLGALLATAAGISFPAHAQIQTATRSAVFQRITTPARADEDQTAPIRPEDISPQEELVEFRVAPDLVATLGSRRIVATDLVLNRRFSDIGETAILEEQQIDAQEALNEGWAHFGLAFGIGGSITTFAEHALRMGAFANTNAAFTNLGLLMAVWQVTLDLGQNQPDQAAMNAYRGVQGYAVGRFGSGALQIANIGAFLIDQSLQMFGTAALEEHQELWRQAYNDYYRERDATAERGEYGVQPTLTPTQEEDIARIRAQRTAGRSEEDWMRLLWYYYTQARNPDGFRSLLEVEVNRYATLFWDDPELAFYLNNTGRARLFNSGMPSEQDRRVIEAEYRRALLQTLSEEVLPEIAARAWIREMQEQARALTAETRDEMNTRRQIVVSAFDLSAPATLIIPRPDGGAWRTTLQPGQARVLNLTNLAYLLTGGPSRLRLERADGSIEEAAFSLEDSERAVVQFGRPSNRQVMSYQVQEGAQTCTRATRALRPNARWEVSALADRPARATWTLHMSGTAGSAGQGLIGHYDPGTGWAEASMVRYNAEANRSEMTEPFVDGVSRMACTMDVNALHDPAAMAQYITSMSASLPLHCQLTRTETTLQDGIETRTLCTSDATLRMNGVLVSLPEGERFVDLEDMMRDFMGDDAGAIMQGLQGLMQMQPGGPLPQIPGGWTQ